MSYCEGVLAAIERRAQGRPVARFKVRIGVVHRVVADAFAQSFELAAGGGIAADAVPEVMTIPVQATCRDCGASFESDEPHPACSACGALEVATQGGDEVVLEWIEYRADDVEVATEVVPEHTHAGGH